MSGLIEKPQGEHADFQGVWRVGRCRAWVEWGCVILALLYGDCPVGSRAKKGTSRMDF